MAGSPVPATGVAWNTAVPDNSQPHGNDFNEHRETKLAVGIRMTKEHVAFAAASVGGEHKEGSANIYVGDYSVSAAGDALPTTKPDGSTALDTNDKGRLAYDTDATYGGIFYRWSGSAWAQIPLVALTGNQTIAGIKTFSSFPVTPSSAPTTDYQAANKKFVDDQIASARLLYSGATVFNATLTSSNTWQDLNLSSIVGAKRAMCFFHIYADAAVYYVMRTKGISSGTVGDYTGGGDRGAAHHYAGVAGYSSMFVCSTDANGILQHGATNISATMTVKLLHYLVG